MKKILKIIFTFFCVILVLLYLIFLFVLPSLISFDKIKPQIQQECLKKLGLEIDFKNGKVVTLPAIDVAVSVDDLSLSYPDKEKLFRVNKAYIGIDLVSLFFNKINIEEVLIDKPEVNFYKIGNGEYKINSTIKKISELTTASPEAEKETRDFELAFNNSKIRVFNYSINYFDLTKKADKYSVQGDSFIIRKLRLNKKIDFETSGKLSVNSKKLIGYHFNIDSELPPAKPQEDVKIQKVPQLDFSVLEKLAKYNFLSNVDANLKIRNIEKAPRLFGDIEVKKISFKSNDKMLPESEATIDFRGDEATLNSEFYTNQTDKIEIRGQLTPFVKKNIDLKVKAENIDLNDIKHLAISFLDMSGQKVEDLRKLDLKGVLAAKFNIISDYKNFDFEGNLNLKNAYIGVQGVQQAAEKINISAVSDDGVMKIQKGEGYIGKTKFTIDGTINKHSDVDININVPVFYLNTAMLIAKSLPFDDVTKKSLNDFGSTSGSVAIKAHVFDKLEKPNTDIALNLKNISAYYKPAKMMVNFPHGDINIEDNVAEIKNVIFALNKAPIMVNGKVNNLDKNPDFYIEAKGKLSTKDLAALNPKALSGLKPQAILPLEVKISGNTNKTNIIAQIFIARNTKLPMIELHALKNSSMILNLEMLLSKNNLNFSNTGLFSGVEWENDFSNNIAKAEKIIDVRGSINNINSKNPIINNVAVMMPKPLDLTVNMPPVINLKAKNTFIFKGNLNNPTVIIDGTLSNINIPLMKTSINAVDLTTEDGFLNVQTSTVNAPGSTLIANAKIDMKNLNTVTVKDLKVTSDFIDFDKLMTVMSNPKLFGKPTPTSAFVIQNGLFNGMKIKTGNVVATEVSCDYNLDKQNKLSMNNIKAQALGGAHTGRATLNLYNTRFLADITSNNIQGAVVSKEILMSPNQITGTINSVAKINTRGQTPVQQMNNLNGIVTFKANDGVLGNWGRMEFFINAPNLSGLKANRVLGSLQPKNTGQYDEIKGLLILTNGVANIEYISSKGQNMSLYVQGKYHLSSNIANMLILGRASQSVIDALGPIGSLSVNQALGKIDNKFGVFAQYAYSMYYSYQEKMANYPTELIPPLSSSQNSKDFVVTINGPITTPTSVKQFKWLTK